MPDYSIDTSIYKTAPPAGSLANMSLLDLLGAAYRMRRLQSQQAMTDALHSQMDQNTGLIDYTGAQRSLVDSGAQVSPADTLAMTKAAEAQSGLQLTYAHRALDAITGWLGEPNKTKDKLMDRAGYLARSGAFPPQMIADALANLPSNATDAQINQHLVNWRNYLTGGKELPLTEVPGAGGAPTRIPSAQANVQAVGGPAPAVGGTGLQTTQPTPASNQFDADLTKSSNYRREVLPLEQAIPALARLGKTGTFPGADELNKIKTFMIGIGADKALGINLGSVKDFTEAQKYLIDWANMVSAGGTNDRLAATFASNPNTTMYNAAALDVAKTALSVRRMQQAQVAEFQKLVDAGQMSKNQYLAWAQKWNAAQDPRAFGFDLMTSDAAKSMLAKMPADEKKRFLASLAIAERNNLTSPRGGWNAE